MFPYVIADRVFHGDKPLNERHQLDAQKNYLFDLNDYLGVVDALGEKALSFLQCQLTADVNAVSDIQMVQAAQCNLQGRIVALMDVFLWNGLKLLLPKDLIEVTCQSFQKAAMLSRVTFAANPHYSVLGFYLQNKDDLLPEMSFFPTETYALTYHGDYCCYSLGKGFYVLISTLEFGHKIRALFEEKQQMKGSLDWHSLRLEQKQLTIYPKSRGLFLPHRLDLQQTPYLSFSKGCYKGQEIIARMHYKATLKHELKLFEVQTDDCPEIGQKIKQEGIEIAELVDYSYLGDNHYLIAVSLLKGSHLDGLYQRVQEKGAELC